MTFHQATLRALPLLLFLGGGLLHAAERIVVFGDSLSKEYQVEFPHLPARNWIEILDQRRHFQFDIGSFAVFPDFRATGHEYNWSYPGATSWQMYENLTKSGFFQEIARKTIEKHLRGADRVVIMLGGNDFDAYYEGIYKGNDPAPYIDRSYNNLRNILLWVKRRNGSVPIVLANTPHIGATPRVRGDFPTDPVKTKRATDAVMALNERLRKLAQDEGVGHADVFAITYSLLLGKPLVVSGMRFRDHSDDSGKTEDIWLGGLGGRFHPNTIGQAMLANAIIDGFNRRYHHGIDRLGGAEIVSSLLDRQVDVPFSQWIAAYETGPASNANDDPDYDGLLNQEEFALDLDPTKPDDDWPGPDLTANAQGSLRLRYRPRVAQTRFLESVVQVSRDLRTWEDAPLSKFQPDRNGYWVWESGLSAAGPLFTRHRVRLLE